MLHLNILFLKVNEFKIATAAYGHFQRYTKLQSWIYWEFKSAIPPLIAEVCNTIQNCSCTWLTIPTTNNLVYFNFFGYIAMCREIYQKIYQVFLYFNNIMCCSIYTSCIGWTLCNESSKRLYKNTQYMLALLWIA